MLQIFQIKIINRINNLKIKAVSEQKKECNNVVEIKYFPHNIFHYVLCIYT